MWFGLSERSGSVAAGVVVHANAGHGIGRYSAPIDGNKNGPAVPQHGWADIVRWTRTCMSIAMCALLFRCAGVVCV